MVPSSRGTVAIDAMRVPDHHHRQPLRARGLAGRRLAEAKAIISQRLARFAAVG
jgi:hypothetical protein